MNGCILVTLCALAGQAPLDAHPDDHFERLAEARAALSAAHTAEPDDATTALKLAAVQMLSGDYQRATELASGLFTRGRLSVTSAAARTGRDFERAFTALLAKPADVETANDALAKAARSRDPAPGDIAWPFARAFALARSGESHAAASLLERLAQRLREGAGLQVANLRFTTRVTSFGVYEEDARASIRPGDSLLVYAEPRGFRSSSVPGRPPGEPRWRVQLRMTVTLHDLVARTEAGRWGPDEVTHVTRSLIHDMHVTRLVELAPDLRAGAYELRLSLEDPADPPRTGLGIKRLTVGK